MLGDLEMLPPKLVAVLGSEFFVWSPPDASRTKAKAPAYDLHAIQGAMNCTNTWSFIFALVTEEDAEVLRRVERLGMPIAEVLDATEHDESYLRETLHAAHLVFAPSFCARLVIRPRNRPPNASRKALAVIEAFKVSMAPFDSSTYESFLSQYDA